MKTLKLNALVLIALFLMTIRTATAKNEYEKNYNKEFEVTENTTFSLINKYGEVNIKNWDKDIISIKVTIRVEADKEKQAEEVFKKIEINFSTDDALVKAETKIIKNLNNNNFSINYDINAPKYIKLNASNKYGNMFINEIAGHTVLKVKYGNLKINRLSYGEGKLQNRIILGYSHASIEQCNRLKIFVKYSNLKINDSKILDVESKYSQIYINKSNFITANSKYDTPFKVGTVKKFVCDGKYSEYKVAELNKTLTGNIKYSSLKIQNVAADFKSIVLSGEYGDIAISAPKATYRLSTETSHSELTCPPAGIVGNGKNPQSKITLSLKYSTFKLQ